MIWIIREKNNETVTGYYFQILQQAAELVCDNVIVTDEIKKGIINPSRDIVIVGSIIKAIKLHLKGYKNIIVWFQGVVPEESYMKRKSFIRKRILEKIEKYILKKTILAIFVSKAMKEHYEEKYKININDNFYIMPCFNTEINKEAFFKKEKYKNNIFAYTGGLSVWQGFDKILKCYERIEKLGIPNTQLLVLTPDKEKALHEIKKTNIKNYKIGYVETQELPSILADVKFGFVIREDNIVNQVATPTKLSTYIANGLIPIYSECIRDFHEVTSEIKFRLPVNSSEFDKKIMDFMTTEIDPTNVYNEYLIIFNKYYNTQYHRLQLSLKFKEILSGN